MTGEVQGKQDSIMELHSPKKYTTGFIGKFFLDFMSVRDILL